MGEFFLQLSKHTQERLTGTGRSPGGKEGMGQGEQSWLLMSRQLIPQLCPGKGHTEPGAERPETMGCGIIFLLSLSCVLPTTLLPWTKSMQERAVPSPETRAGALVHTPPDVQHRDGPFSPPGSGGVDH